MQGAYPNLPVGFWQKRELHGTIRRTFAHQTQVDAVQLSVPNSETEVVENLHLGSYHHRLSNRDG